MKFNHKDLVAEAREKLGDVNVNLTIEAHGSDVIEIGSFNIEDADLLATVRTKIHEAYALLPGNMHKLNARLNANFFFTKDARLYLHTHIRIRDFMDVGLDHAELMEKIHKFGMSCGFIPNEEDEEIFDTTPHIPKILIVGCDSRVNTKQLARVLSSEIGMTCVQSLETASAIKAHLAPTKEDPLALHVPPFVISLPDNQFGMGDDVINGLFKIDGLKLEWSWGYGDNGEVEIFDDVNKRAAKRLLEIDMLKASKKSTKQ